MSLYAQANEGLKQEFRERTRQKFRTNILQYLEETYQFFSLQLKPRKDEEDSETEEEEGLDAMHRAIEKHFRRSIGKVFRPYSDEKFMYVAIEPRDAYYEENLQLLSDLSQDFTIRHYKLNTNPTDNINKFYQIEAELSGIETGAKKVLKEEYLRLEDFKDEVFLIGGWRKDKNQLGWIQENMLYNVRKKMRGQSRNGVQKIEKGIVDAHYLLLYEIGAESMAYDLYRIDHCSYLDEKKMARRGYPEPSGKYIVYKLELMPKAFKQIDIAKVIRSEYTRVLEEHRKNKEAYEWADFEGTPIYVTGKEIMEILAE